MEVRKHLLAGQPIDLSLAPDCVSTIINDANNSGHSKRIDAARRRHCGSGETVLVIGDAMHEQGRLQIARQMRGLTPIEPADHKRSLIPFMDDLDLSRSDLDAIVVSFAASVMVGVNPRATIDRLTSLRCGRNRKAPSDIETVALNFTEAPSYAGVKALIQAFQSSPQVRVFRPEVLQLATHALDELISNSEVAPGEADRRARERFRRRPRRLPARGIGSTLLLKGLECDHIVILNANSLSVKDLYVALTRAKLTITICTSTSTLTPR